MRKTPILLALLLVLVAAAGGFLIFGGGPERQAPRGVAAPENPAPPPVAAAPQPAPGFSYLRYQIDTGKPSPEACLEFNQRLNTSTAASEQVRIASESRVAARIDGSKLCLAGLAYGRDYTVSPTDRLTDEAGAALQKPFKITINLGERPPMVAFAGNGYILSSRTTQGLAIDTTNVSKVGIKVLRVGDRLIAREMRESWNSGELWSYQLKTLESERASLVWQGQMDIQRLHNQNVTTIFPLSQALKERKPGAYLVVARNADRRAGSDEDSDYGPVTSRWVVQTDMALTTFQARDGLTVALRSLETAKPMAGRELTLVATNNDELGRATTGADGLARFDAGLLRGSGGSSPSVVMAYGPDGDFAILDLKRAGFDFADRGVGGRAFPGPVDAFLYTDRGIYRPGESVELMALVRDRLANAIEARRATLSVMRPNGTEYRRLQVDPVGSGAARATIALPQDASRGLWKVALLADGGVQAGKIEFDVQDFVPQRLSVQARIAEPVLKPSEAFHLELSSAFLYGAPAAELGTEAELSLEADATPFPRYREFRFGAFDETFETIKQPISLGETDAQGHVRGEGKLPAFGPTSKPLKAVVTAGVFEPGGRLTSTKLTLPVAARPSYVGIRPLFTNGRVSEGTDAQFEIVALDQTGSPVALGGLRYTVLQEDWDYFWYREGSRWSWRNVVTTRQVHSGDFSAEAGRPATLSYRPKWGRFRLIVEHPASGAVSSIRFASGWSGSETTETPDQVTVTSERPAYGWGQQAKVAIKAPFAGQAMVTVASDRVLSTRMITLPGSGAEVTLDVQESWGTGAYVLVSAYRALEEGKSYEPVRAVGLVWIAVDNAPRTLGVTLGAPDKIAPRGRLTVPVTVTGTGGEPAFVTLAAVDEGILQLTRFQTPDPAGHFYGKRQLGVTMRDDYGRLLDGQGQVGPIRAGGDSLGGAGLPVVPTKSLALFSGLVALDGDGKATITLDMPDFNGQVRLMAVAHSRTRIGSTDAKVIVRDPVIAEASLPRFLAPGDEGRLTLLVHNVEGGAGQYRVRLQASGAVVLSADQTEQIFDLKPEERRIATVPIAGLEAGIGRVVLSVEGSNGFSVTRDWQIAVRPPHFPIALEQTALHARGEDFRVDPALLDAFLPGTAEISVNYSPLAGVDIAGMVASLWRYPYGCAEQIVSVALPLLSFDDPRLVGRAAGDTAQVRDRVQRAIETLLERQDGEGRFGLYRAGDGWASLYVNAYVLDFLSLAKKARYIVPDVALSSGLSWLGTNVLDPEASWRRNRTYDDSAYAFYVLAREQRADVGDLRNFADSRGGQIQAPLALAQTAGALSFIGDVARAERFFSAASRKIGWNSHADWYGSPARDFAGTLAIAAEARHERTIQQLLPQLNRYVGPVDGMNTQQKSWFLRAAANLARDSQPAFAINGIVQAGLGKGPNAFRPSTADVRAGYAITNQATADVWRSLVITGVPRQAPPPMANGFEIDKTLLTMSGGTLEPDQLSQNDRFIVLLEGSAKGTAARTAVLVDMLPAGWEIESPVLRREGGKSDYAFLPKLSDTLVREARDDRFVASFALNSRNVRSFYQEDSEDEGNAGSFATAYVVRAVTPGSFVLPAAIVEDMYRPTDTARSQVLHTIVKAK